MEHVIIQTVDSILVAKLTVTKITKVTEEEVATEVATEETTEEMMIEMKIEMMTKNDFNQIYD
jgi:hypothetical protein